MARLARDVAPEPVNWALEDYVARGIVTLVASPRNMGKSQVAVWIAAEGSTGGPMALGRRLRVLINTQEDHLGRVLRPRLEVAGADLQRVSVSAEPWRLPEDLGRVRDQVALSSSDIVILDSVQQHVPRYQHPAVASEAMRGLITMTEELDVAAVLIGHTVKTVRESVEAAIGGAGVLQNLSEAVFVLGPEPRWVENHPIGGTGTAGLPCAICGQPSGDDGVHCPLHAGEQKDPDYDGRVLACERFGIGPLPPSLLFEMQTRFLEVTGREEPFLKLREKTEYASADVLAAIRKARQVPELQDPTKGAEVALWMRETLMATGPMPTEEFIARAKKADRCPSRNTFDRARKVAGVESIRPSELEKVLGAERYAALSDDEKQVFWVRVPELGDPPLGEWAE